MAEKTKKGGPEGPAAFSARCSTLLLLIFCGMALRWELKQTYAWGNMLRERVGTQGIAEAVESTFSGKAPCGLCHQITVACTDSEKDSSYQVQEPPQLCWIPSLSGETEIFPPRRSGFPRLLLLFPQNPTYPPGTPPPRFSS